MPTHSRHLRAATLIATLIALTTLWITAAPADAQTREIPPQVIVELSDLPRDLGTVLFATGDAQRIPTNQIPPPPPGGRFRFPLDHTWRVSVTAELNTGENVQATQLAFPIEVCLPRPSWINVPVILLWDDHDNLWSNQLLIRSNDDRRICARVRDVGIVSVVADADLAAWLTTTDIHNHTAWMATFTVMASELLLHLPQADSLWAWTGRQWIGYAGIQGVPLPGAVDFPILPNTTVWIGTRNWQAATTTQTTDPNSGA